LRYRLENEGKTRKDKIKVSVRKGLSTLSKVPLRYAIVFKNSEIEIRKMALNQVYSIFYSVIGNEVVVLRIWHNSRNPEELDLG
jgi:plasmid stabilization system protein ParE